jgi:putative salt-induced outer membrane protein YdiY
MNKTAALWLLALGFASVAQADEIVLETGDVLVGDIVEETEDGIVMEHPMLGRITIPAAQIKPPDPPEPVNPGLFGTRFLEGWSRQLSAGMSGAAGNTTTFNIDAQLSMKHETDRHRGNWLSAFFYATSDDEATTNRFITAYEHDLLFENSRWFVFGTGRYDYDDFKAWDHRIAISAGGGYEFFKADFFELRGRTGIGYSQTFGDEKESRPEGRAGIEGIWNITEHQNFTFRGTFYPDFSDIPEYRTTAGADWNINLVDVQGLGLKIGFLHEYESQTASVSGHDLRYYGNVAYGF